MSVLKDSFYVSVSESNKSIRKKIHLPFDFNSRNIFQEKDYKFFFSRETTFGNKCLCKKSPK